MQDRDTFRYEATGLTEDGPVRVFVRYPDGHREEPSPEFIPDFAEPDGELHWRFSPSCDMPAGEYMVWAVDTEAEKESNRVTQEVLENPDCDQTSQPSPDISASIDSYTADPRSVEVGQTVNLSFQFTNTGSDSWTFQVAASLRRPDGSEVNLPLKSVSLDPGEQGRPSWSHTFDTSGSWDLVFGVWQERSQNNSLAHTGWLTDYITATQATEPQPGISLSTNSLNFGEVNVRDSTDRTVTIESTGNATLNGTVSASAPYSIVSGGSFQLESGETQAVRIRFAPNSAGSFADSLTLNSNAGKRSISVSGTGIEEAQPPTQPGAPEAPSRLGASDITTNQITLHWQDNADTESGFHLERKPASNNTYQRLATLEANATTYPNTGLPSNTSYCYRVRAFNSAGNSAYSQPVCTSTHRSEPTQPQAPQAPSNLEATTASATRIELSWQDNSDTEGWFIVKRKIGSESFEAIASKLANTTSHVDTDLSEGTTACYQVIAANDAGNSDPSNEACATTGGGGGEPPSEPPDRSPNAAFTWHPTDPRAGDSIQFTNNSEDPDGNITKWLWTFGDGATSTRKSPTYTYNSAGTYQVALQVEDSQGNTDTASQTITIAEDSGGPVGPPGGSPGETLEAPSDLTAEVVANDQILLAWQPPIEFPDGYIIQRKIQGRTYEDLTTLENSSAAMHMDDGLQGGTTYCYQVKAYSSNTQSDPSNEVCATTSGAEGLPPGSPGDGSGDLQQFDTNNNCLIDTPEFPPIIDKWTAGQISDPLFFDAMDAWTERTNICTESASAQPLILSQVSSRTTFYPNQIRFVAQGHGINSMEVAVYTMNGQKIFAGEALGSRLVWNLHNTQHQRIANGVYLYQVTTKGPNGQIERSKIRKLMVTR